MIESQSVHQALKISIELSRQELQHHQLLPGDVVCHEMFGADLTVIKHIDSLVHVETTNPYTGRKETAVLPLNELYYPDLAAGALMLQLEL
jgi:hypothetical protein